MERLVEYESSDSEDECKSRIIHHQHNDEGHRESSGTGPEEVQRTWNNERSDGFSQPKCDFFNLSSEPNDSDYVPEVKENQEVSEPRTNIDTQYGCVVVPDGRFWNDFTPTEIKTRQQKPLTDLDGKGAKRQRESGQLRPLKYHKQDDVVSSSETPVTFPTKQQNVFYVHHKIGPHLVSSQTRSRVPRKVALRVNAHGSGINRLKWCSRKEYSHLLASASMDTTVKIWNLLSSESLGKNRKELKTFTMHSKGVRDIVWSHSGKEVLSCGYDKKVFISDVEKGLPTQSYKHTDYVTCLDIHPVDPHVFLSGTRGAILHWDIRRNSQQPVKEFRYKDDIGQVQDVLLINDGAELISVGDIVTRDSADRTIMVWDFKTTVVLSNQVYQERYTCTRLLSHPEDASFLVQTNGNYLSSFSTQRPYKMNKCKRFEGHTVHGYNIGCDKSPDGKIIISGSSDGQLTCYDYYTTKVMKRLDTGFSVCLDVAYHPVLSNTVACCSWDGEIGLLQ